MPGVSLFRAFGLLAFIVTVEGALYVLDARPAYVVLGIALAWAAAAAYEWLAWRQAHARRPSPARRFAQPHRPAVNVSPAPAAGEPSALALRVRAGRARRAERQSARKEERVRAAAERDAAERAPEAEEREAPDAAPADEGPSWRRWFGFGRRRADAADAVPPADEAAPRSDAEPTKAAERDDTAPREPTPPDDAKPAAPEPREREPNPPPPRPRAALRSVPPTPPPRAPAPPSPVTDEDEDEGSVVQLGTRRREPREWNLWELERIAREEARRSPARSDEWSYLFVHLREFATAGGTLPADFDGLVRDTFGPLLETLDDA